MYDCWRGKFLQRLLMQSDGPTREMTTAFTILSKAWKPFKPIVPREGGDRAYDVFSPLHGHFNPRPPRGRRRCHAIRRQRNSHFNPRPPRGRRPFPSVPSTNRSAFQSSPPAREATVDINRPWKGPSISILAPREGGDRVSVSNMWGFPYFNPRPPRGRRLV